MINSITSPITDHNLRGTNDNTTARALIQRTFEDSVRVDSHKKTVIHSKAPDRIFDAQA